jgi:AraC-like DNA-binding protein
MSFSEPSHSPQILSNSFSEISDLDYSKKLVEQNAPAWIYEVLKYMTDHFDDDIRLDDLSIIHEISKFHMCRQFKKHLKITPLKWLWTFRALLASELLRLPMEWSIQEVAFASGFTSSAHFARVFKEVFGITASQYREEYTSYQRQIASKAEESKVLVVDLKEKNAQRNRPGMVSFVPKCKSQLATYNVAHAEALNVRAAR